MEAFKILCDRLLQKARSHSEKDRLRVVYQSSEDWAIKWAEMNQVTKHYDRILAIQNA